MQGAAGAGRHASLAYFAGRERFRTRTRLANWLGDPASLRGGLLIGDLGVAAVQVREHEPGQGAAGHQADDQEPPVELGGHRGTARRRGVTCIEAEDNRLERGAAPGLHCADMPAPLFLAALFAPALALIAITPDPIAFHVGSIPVYWYGVCYAVGLAAAYVVITREAHRRGLNERLVDNGIIIVAAAALVGGRLYHVIDQWQLYRDDLVAIVLPPYSGLGVYGGILTGTIAWWS